jgi:SPP1 gp7 family putative phage head morphogenesis protein
MVDIDTVTPLGFTSNTERKIAEGQVQQLARIDRQGDVIVRKYADAIKKAALYALTKGQRLELTDEAINGAIAELVGLSMLAYVTSAKTHFVDPDIQAELAELSLSQEGLSLASKQRQAYRRQVSQFDKDVARVAKKFDINVGVLSKKLHAIVAPNMRDSLHKVKRELNSTLSQLSADKIPTRQATKLLTEKLTSMGVAPNNGAYVETLVRTHSQMAYNAAQHIELEKDAQIWGYKYVTVGDDRVRPEHARLDGLVKKKDNEIWKTIWPPNGWNCRCQVLPIYDPEAQTRLPNNTKDLVDPAFRFNPGLELV